MKKEKHRAGKSATSTWSLTMSQICHRYVTNIRRRKNRAVISATSTWSLTGVTNLSHICHKYAKKKKQSSDICNFHLVFDRSHSASISPVNMLRQAVKSCSEYDYQINMIIRQVEQKNFVPSKTIKFSVLHSTRKFIQSVFSTTDMLHLSLTCYFGLKK